MPGTNPFKQLLPDITGKPPMVPADVFHGQDKLGEDQLMLLRRAGLTADMIQRSIEEDLRVSYERTNLYSEIERALQHWFVGSAIDLYANVATTYNPIHDATVWVTAESDTYQKELEDLLERVKIEEVIHDWAYQVAGYGDLFVQLNGVPGLGVISVDDSAHPVTIGRVDYQGMLIGFYKTPQGQMTEGGTTVEMLPPWDYVHFRLLGAKLKRSEYGEHGAITRQQVHLISGGDTRQLTTRYGTGIPQNGLPAYKRLRLAEDSLLLARISRGIIKYIWKLRVDGTNAEAVSALMDRYATLITRARSVDTGSNPAYDSKQNPMTVIEDIFVPVWGDVNDLGYEKVGGEADIRWIVDIDNLRQQLAFSLATPPALGGAYVDEASGSLGSEAIGKLDIRFSRSARRVQRALISGITRMCQIHLAYRGYDPDTSLFQIHMAETSSAEEEQLRKSIDQGIKTFVTMVKGLKTVVGRKLDPAKAWDYYNDKILKLEDFRLEDMEKSSEEIKQEIELQQKREAAKAQQQPPGGPGEEAPGTPAGGAPPEGRRTVRLRPESRQRRRRGTMGDTDSYLPIVLSGSDKLNECKLYENKKVKVLDPSQTPLNKNVGGFLTERTADVWESRMGGATVAIVDTEEDLQKVVDSMD